MLPTFEIRIDDITSEIIANIRLCINFLNNINLQIGANTISWWVVLKVFFALDVILFALFEGDETKN